eukprot:CAMPEP_0202914272 /NCGR_PEP_ID=MMETSP1392-20130828/62690_1 /ASSEMBLY_ACC=CAM_ASM_000868 /TAXON_ID=225041 /ORGANISM="Chlamydomonas chlamydogama, Strain SAG 11-48b" /LENGTH=103 /DNA_ID=CAMNT_0049605865 /DNA_START=65 /DNA_END=373 /DNA_ORIENTATION=+
MTSSSSTTYQAQSQPPHTLRDTPAAVANSWSWPQVQRVSVLGLGSLGGYREALASGRASSADCTRASCRLHQLALALMLRQLPPHISGPAAAEQLLLDFHDPE